MPDEINPLTPPQSPGHYGTTPVAPPLPANPLDLSLYQWLDPSTGKVKEELFPDLIIAGLRQGTKAELDAAYPALLDNEPAFETDTKVFRIGSERYEIKTASEFGKQLISQPSKRSAQGLLSVPLPFAAFTHTLTQDEWRKAAKFTSTKSTAVTGYIKSTTGYIKCLDHDGTWETVVGNGVAGNNQATNFTASGDNIPRFYAIIPCDASGNLSGDLTFFNITNNQLTSFDGTGLSSLTGLYLDNNQLTSFDGTGLSSLTGLYLRNNQLTSFDGTGLSLLIDLYLDNNQLTSFDGTGLSSLTGLYLYDNQLTSFDGTGLSSLTYLYLDNNQLADVSLGDVSGACRIQMTDPFASSGQQSPNIDANNQVINSTYIGIYLQNGDFTEDQLLAFFNTLGNGGNATIHVYGTPALLDPDWTTTKAVATGKGYTVNESSFQPI